jgi:hypothetical protein
MLLENNVLGCLKTGFPRTKEMIAILVILQHLSDSRDIINGNGVPFLSSAYTRQYGVFNYTTRSFLSPGYPFDGKHQMFFFFFPVVTKQASHPFFPGSQKTNSSKKTY